jgi:hypothetical protein
MKTQLQGREIAFQTTVENGMIPLPAAYRKAFTAPVFVVVRESAADDGSLAYLFRNYADDGVREPLVDFGKAVGNEKW